MLCKLVLQEANSQLNPWLGRHPFNYVTNPVYVKIPPSIFLPFYAANYTKTINTIVCLYVPHIIYTLEE